MKRIALAFMALALILTACQSVSESIAENLTEKALEGVEGVEGVDIDTDSGQISVETEDGKVTIGGGEMPDDFMIPAPDGYKVTSVFTNDESAAVSLAYDGGNFDQIVTFYDDWTAAQPENWEKSSSSISTDEGTLNNASWAPESGGGFITASNLCIVFDESIDPENCVSVNLNTGSG